MTLIYNGQEHPVRVLLDCGSTVPVMSFSKAQQWKLPLVKRPQARQLLAFNATYDDQGGRYFTEELVLRHKEDHFTSLSFELSKIQDQDIILPH
ncbi:hypothetical protein CIB48_g11490 [Xylaria polymorpha]|nr:hypothetical protein CIB48_g11490 [Xylaria polymorpha]